MADLAYLQSSGFAQYIHWCHAAHVPIVGICGGYQMLGKRLFDPQEVESTTSTAEGLGLLDQVTTFAAEKKTGQVRALSPDFCQEVAGYEIHMGRTQNASHVRPMFHVIEEGGMPVSRLDGGRSENGLVWGTYIRQAATLAQRINDDSLDFLVGMVREHLDLPLLQDLLDGAV
jgi:adenosylcobyric acid synthase